MAVDSPVDETLDTITKMCEEVEKTASTSFLVQFYGIHEVTDSFENSNLLVSQQFRDVLDKVDKGVKVSCFFVFQDLHAVVGSGTVARKEEEGEQEPYDITVNWSKLTTLQFADFESDSVGESVVKIIQDEDDLNWEIKELTDEQAVFLDNAVFVAAEETVESLRARYEEAVQPFQQQYDAEGDHDADAAASGDGGRDTGPGDNETEVRGQLGTAAEGQGESAAGAQHSITGDHPSGPRVGSRQRSQDRAHVRSRESSVVRGGDGFHPFDGHGGHRELKRSRIPFDVTKMSYDQYCAKHYSYAIEMYRAEKLRLWQLQQQQALMAGGMMGMGMGAAGAAPPGSAPSVPGVPGVPGAVPTAAAGPGVAPGVGAMAAGFPSAVPGMPLPGAGMMGMSGMPGMMMPHMQMPMQMPGMMGGVAPATYGQPAYKPQ